MLYAHANRGPLSKPTLRNVRALVQAQKAPLRGMGDHPTVTIPLTTAEMDQVFDLPYARAPHPSYADENGSLTGAPKFRPGR